MGNYPYSDVKFTWADWQRYQRDLSLADPVMMSMTEEYSMKLITPAKYPSKMLKKRKWMKIFQISLTLDPESIKVQKPSYTLIVAYHWKLFPFYYKHGEWREIDRLSPQDLQSSAKIKASMQKALRELVTTYGM